MSRHKELLGKVAGWTCAAIVLAILLAGAVASVRREVWLWRMYLEAE